jgi:hypothetical protein
MVYSELKNRRAEGNQPDLRNRGLWLPTGLGTRSGWVPGMMTGLDE